MTHETTFSSYFLRIAHQTACQFVSTTRGNIRLVESDIKNSTATQVDTLVYLQKSWVVRNLKVDEACQTSLRGKLSQQAQASEEPHPSKDC